MKGNISLTDFIKEVKGELRAAIDNEDPFFEMGEVELEVTFALDIGGKAGVKLVVLDLGGETKATQTHKVKIKLHPFVEEPEATRIVSGRSEGFARPTGVIRKPHSTSAVNVSPNPSSRKTMAPKASKSKPSLTKSSPTAKKSKTKADS